MNHAGALIAVLDVQRRALRDTQATAIKHLHVEAVPQIEHIPPRKTVECLRDLGFFQWRRWQFRLLISRGQNGAGRITEDPGCLSLFGREPEAHRMFAEHVAAEYRVKTEGRGRTVDEWKLGPEASDNHWLDGLVGSAVGASMQGAVLPGTGGGKPEKKKERVKLFELQRKRR